MKPEVWKPWRMAVATESRDAGEASGSRNGEKLIIYEVSRCEWKGMHRI